MDILIQKEKDGKAILEKHYDLKEILLGIPTDRKMTFRIDSKNGNEIGKPRYEPSKYEWDPKLLNSLLTHLQNIWDYLNKYSWYFDSKILPFLHQDKRRMSKESIIFLLEKDVWNTDEIYGDYLIEKGQSETNLFYYRRNEKRQSFSIVTISNQEIEAWIMHDAQRQITDRFEIMWQLLELEIDSCRLSRIIKPIRINITNDRLINRIQEIGKLIDIDENAAVLVLGQCAEIWSILQLGLDQKPREYGLITKLLRKNIIDQRGKRLLNKIRGMYNSAKHQAFFVCNVTDLRTTFLEFQGFAAI